ncbi:Nucleoporin [Nosema granulosis]|uniref:Nucleoporin n=1 Tax=Nosema granulosis TaxID=83296 RepID=A0A9P6H0F6_9MICR|nr:Nucleoporin [Nosema granulosis]
MSFNIFNKDQQNQNQPPKNPFGQPQQSTTPVFGQPQQQNSAPVFGQQQNSASIFGQPQQQNSAPVFGQPQQQNSAPVFGQQQQQSTTPVFGQQQQQNSASIFGQPQQQSSTPVFGQQQQQNSASIFGQQQQQNSAPVFGQQQNNTPVVRQQSNTNTNTTPAFGQASTLNDSTTFGQTQNPFAPQTPSQPVSNGSIQSTTFKQQTPTADSSKTGLDKSSSFVQMNLYEIIQQQVRKLEDNISDFNTKAREIFIEDEKIMKALNNYKAINTKLENEEMKITELEGRLEAFEKSLEEFSTRVPSSGDDDDLLLCIKKFEEISDSYNKSIENIKDEDDEVLGLVKENYNLCSLIDDKLDLFERYQ